MTKKKSFFLFLPHSIFSIMNKNKFLSTSLIILIPLRGKPISINLNYVSYFSQCKNNTFIHSIHGEPSFIYSTLSYIQDYLSTYCLRINRDTIVTFSNIVSYNHNSVTVKGNNKNSYKSFLFYKKEANEILFTLGKTVPELEEKNAVSSQKIENETVNDDEKTKIDTVKTAILEEIKQNPGINAQKIYENFQDKSSLSTIKRKLKTLTDNGIIKHQGSDKTGGYFISSSSPTNS